MFALKLCAAGALSSVLSCAAVAAVAPAWPCRLVFLSAGAIGNVRHNDMGDAGSAERQARTLAEIEKFLQKQGGQDGA
ncbi:hypothetical protein F2P44_18830 [Massilia sp. CCM 8695]|uniref:Uncharacterized protein n=1 Tax=Massilia frigida TaxID=2609281 RepID=A0ABX0N7F7_9BURK|nr:MULTISPECIES: hypothetical protein [Massilia]MDM5181639.1 hypothetical protein [Massilia sp. DJPM01]NHZ81315.1 hypothetical protein [Massilia frigida]